MSFCLLLAFIIFLRSHYQSYSFTFEKNISFLLLDASKIFALSLVFKSLTMMCVGEILLEFYRTFWIFGSTCFINFRKSQPLSPQTLLLSSPPPFWNSNPRYVRFFFTLCHTFLPSFLCFLSFCPFVLQSENFFFRIIFLLTSFLFSYI